MSECVVRMEMPEGCFCCPIQGFKSHGVSVCGIGRKSVDRFNGKPDWCPIICQLPEGHGRLVDADALKRKKYHSDITHENAVSVAEIDWAETIVPAERSET